jgi:signal transduction histidine kinase
MVNSPYLLNRYKRYFVFKAILSMIALLVFVMVPSINVQAVSSSVKDVLILTSYEANEGWESNIVTGIYDLLNQDNLTVFYKVENLGLNNKDEKYLKTQAELLKLKYENSNFDLVIVLDDEALNFVTTINTSLFKGTPIIYGGINDASKLSDYPYNTFTGVIEYYNVSSLIDTIFQNHPEATTFNILLSKSIFCQTIENDIINASTFYSDTIKFNFINNDYIENVVTHIQNANSTGTDITILIGNFKTKGGFFLSYNDAISTLKNHSRSPIYTLDGGYIKTEVVGGYILSGIDHGKLIGKIAKRVLNGEIPNTISPIYDTNNLFIFNFTELSKYNIQTEKLPSNSIIEGKPLFYEHIPRVILIGLIFVIIICIMVIINQTYEKMRSIAKANYEKRRYEEVLKYDKMKTEFLANISHELRTPLNVMLSGLQLIDLHRANGDIIFKNHDISDKVGYIKQNGYRLLRLINNLIDVTKIESGFFQLHRENKNIVQVVEDITLSIAEYIKLKGINLIFDTNEEEKILAVDCDKIERIMLNLLSNAVKFTPEKGTIFVNVLCEDNNVKISVKDNGIGIPKDKQNFIFDRFTQVDSSLSRNREGSGIGLSLVKSLVELHHGKIYLDSEVGKGSTFTFEILLPLLRILNLLMYLL